MPDDIILTNSDISELKAWRRALHQHPELSGEEAKTARQVVGMLKPTNPNRILTDLGGHRVAAIYEGTIDGPTALLRCELDGLPIAEVNRDIPHISTVPGKGHL